MNKNILIGTITFAVLWVVLSTIVFACIELTGFSLPAARQIALSFVGLPLALIVARRVAGVTYRSVLVASIVLAALKYLIAFSILHRIAEPVNGLAEFVDLLGAEFWLSAMLDLAAFIIIPQIWLLLLNRLAASSSNPTPLRDAA